MKTRLMLLVLLTIACPLTAMAQDATTRPADAVAGRRPGRNHLLPDLATTAQTAALSGDPPRRPTRRAGGFAGDL